MDTTSPRGAVDYQLTCAMTHCLPFDVCPMQRAKSVVNIDKEREETKTGEAREGDSCLLAEPPVNLDHAQALIWKVLSSLTVTETTM
jgi:hypothetical protein